MKGKHVFNLQPELADCWQDPSPPMRGGEPMELLWEKDGAVVRSSSDGTNKSGPSPTALSSLAAGKARDKARDSRPVGKGLQATGVTSQEDGMVPWLNHPFDDYYSEFFAHVPWDDPNSQSATVPDSRIFRSCGLQVGRSDAHVLEDGSVPRADPEGCNEQPSRMKDSQTCIPSTRILKESDRRDSSEANYLINLPHFSTRQDSLRVRSNLLQFSDRLSGGEKASTRPIQPTTCLRSTGLTPCPQPPQEPVVCRRCSEAIRQEEEDATRHSRNHNDIVNAATSLGLPDNVGRRRRRGSTSFTAAGVGMRKDETEVNPKPVLAFPSMCSANRVHGPPSSDLNSKLKRKGQGGDQDSSEFSGDAEDNDCMGTIMKPLTGRGKRARRRRGATKVTKLSEKRREDEINEKMRALQRLIPNCAKVDEASMLDGAMEYMKILQMQVQIMSMYNGMCMLPMMLPSGMQHAVAPHAYPFAPVGMDAGQGFGMGTMLDMSGGSPRILPVPPTPMHRPLYPSSAQLPAAATAGFLGMPASATHLQMFGLEPPGHVQAAPPSPHPRLATMIPYMGTSERVVTPAPQATGARATSPALAPPPADSNSQQLQPTLQPMRDEASANNPRPLF